MDARDVINKDMTVGSLRKKRDEAELDFERWLKRKKKMSPNKFYSSKISEKERNKISNEYAGEGWESRLAAEK